MHWRLLPVVLLTFVSTSVLLWPRARTLTDSLTFAGSRTRFLVLFVASSWLSLMSQSTLALLYGPSTLVEYQIAWVSVMYLLAASFVFFIATVAAGTNEHESARQTTNPTEEPSLAYLVWVVLVTLVGSATLTAAELGFGLPRGATLPFFALALSLPIGEARLRDFITTVSVAMLPTMLLYTTFPALYADAHRFVRATLSDSVLLAASVFVLNSGLLLTFSNLGRIGRTAIALRSLLGLGCFLGCAGVCLVSYDQAFLAWHPASSFFLIGTLDAIGTFGVEFSFAILSILLVHILRFPRRMNAQAKSPQTACQRAINSRLPHSPRG